MTSSPGTDAISKDLIPSPPAATPSARGSGRACSPTQEPTEHRVPEGQSPGRTSSPMVLSKTNAREGTCGALPPPPRAPSRFLHQALPARGTSRPGNRNRRTNRQELPGRQQTSRISSWRRKRRRRPGLAPTATTARPLGKIAQGSASGRRRHSTPPTGDRAQPRTSHGQDAKP